MSGDVDIIHHLGVIACELDGLAARYERLGFQLTPISMTRTTLRPGEPSGELGIGKRCAIFEDNYLELLGIVDPGRWASVGVAERGWFDIDLRLARYEGLHVLHLASSDLEATRARLVDRGFAPSELWQFERFVETAEGLRTMRARSISFPPGDTPEALFQIAQHDTPELARQPRVMSHPNGARKLTEVMICTSELEDVAARYAKLTGGVVERQPASMSINLGRSRIVIAYPDDIDWLISDFVVPNDPCLASLTIAADLTVTRAYMGSHAVKHREEHGRIIVNSEQAGGVAVQFESATG